VKANLIRLCTAVVSVVSIAAGQPLPLPQQCSTQNVSLGGVVALSGGIDRLEVLTRLLTLTTSQQAQADAIFRDEEAVTKPLVEKLKRASDALTTAEKTAETDANIDQLATNLATTTGQVLAADAKAQSKIYAQLTPEQQQKLEQLPHFFLVPTAPLLPPGPVFVSTSTTGDH
jgi:Spy/CpxP family protein refolding chaperone